MAKYTWHCYKTNEDILSELKINPVVKKIENYSNIRLANGQTNTLNYEVSNMWEIKPRTTPQKTCKTVNRTGTGHKAQNPASYDDDDDDYNSNHITLIIYFLCFFILQTCCTLFYFPQNIIYITILSFLVEIIFTFFIKHEQNFEYLPHYGYQGEYAHPA